MTIDELAKLVEKAELEANERTDRARSSWKALKQDARDAATPWRIVGVGAITGFLAGRSSDAGGGIGRMFGSMAQALITTLGASATAGMAASSAADAAAAATVDATVPPHASDARVDAVEVGAAMLATADAKAAANTATLAAADDDDEAVGAALARTAASHSADVADVER